MADDDWFASMDDEPEPEPEPAAKAPKAGGAKAAGDAAQAQAEAAEGGEEEKAPEEEAPAEDEYLDPDKLILFKHWIRPKFLQYKYLYDYRHNYYNDVIDYLDRKGRGFSSEIPRPQTWAERVLRTYISKIDKLEAYRREIEEKLERAKRIEKRTRRSTFISYHSKEYMSRRITSTL
ncbi:flightin isoform X1 [Harmonia axyridis]|uniref:flightin isoform X1 n=1 Tax=Harmonia axyridis TaxID=115357 RepID=UPI001E275E86|nr:flightin isoform X1 [Harmonia axyridis]